MHALACTFLLLAFIGAPARAAAAESFELLSAEADLVVLGQVLQTGELDGEPVATIAIDRQLSGLEAAGALTLAGRGVGDWRVGERSVFFLRRHARGGTRFDSIAGAGESLAASAAVLRDAPVRSASLRRPPPEPPPAVDPGVSLPGIAAGLLTAAGILALSRPKRRR